MLENGRLFISRDGELRPVGKATGEAVSVRGAIGKQIEKAVGGCSTRAASP